MKKLFAFIMLLLYCLTQAQPEITTYKDKYDEFDYYAKTSTQNDLSKFFKKYIDSDLLKELKSKYKNDYQKRVFLTFSLKNGTLRNVKVNSGYSELDKQIKEAFKKYDINKLNIKDKSSLNKYMLQIISWQNDKAIINCSQQIIIDRHPLLKGCESMLSYSKSKSCINRQIEKHLVKNLSIKEIKKAKIIGSLYLKPSLVFDKNGNVKNATFKTKSESLNAELTSIMTSFPKAIKPPMRNGKPTVLFDKYYAALIIDDTDGSYTKEVTETKESNLGLSSTNELALHFKKHLSKKELQNISFYSRKFVSISFSFDKKGKMINIKSTITKNQKVNNRLVDIFKKFPQEKLNIIPTGDILNMYSIRIISRDEGNNTITCSNTPIVQKPPIFKGCQKSKNSEALKKCFSETVSHKIQREFDTNLRHKTELTGIIRMYCIFKISTEGKIIDVKVKTPNPYLSNEVEKIIKRLPKAIAPGYQNGKPITIPYSLPIVFNVGENKPNDPFKDLEKKRHKF